MQVQRGDDFTKTAQVIPNVLKIDVEGAEQQVVEGLRETLSARSTRHVFLECHPALLEGAGGNEGSLVAAVVELGFEVAHRTPLGGEVHYHFCRVPVS